MQGHNHVRYVGPTTHLNDHRMHHVAKGVSNIWTAAIVAGLGVVVTGTMLFGAMQAEEARAARAASDSDPTKISLFLLDQRLSALEEKLERLSAKLDQPVASVTP